ncbi:MAG: carbonate dehydratase [Pseudomonadota bacterium]|nr:carbonate dehydratase [Pseudomonadota bacterium]
MPPLKDLFEKNRAWTKVIQAQDPEFFKKLSLQQAPKYLWIGCSDSRVPANEIVGLLPGELFVHRNVANVIIHTDLNCLSVIQYAIDVLKVEHIIVCGHYGCGGVRAALEDKPLGLVDNWLRHIRDVYQKHETHLFTIKDMNRRWDKLCELNVIEQVNNVCHSNIVQEAWERGQSLGVHSLIYSIKDGLLRDLGMEVNSKADISRIYHIATDNSSSD